MMKTAGKENLPLMQRIQTCGGDVGADYMQVVRNGQYFPLELPRTIPKLAVREWLFR